jgi:hypothetical protein
MGDKMPYENEDKYLHFTIMHEVSSDVATKDYGFIARTTPGQIASATKWNVTRNSFDWSITRPEKGKETFSRKCPYCEQNLEIEVRSLEWIFSRYKRNRRIGPFILLFSVVFIVVVIVFSMNFAFFFIPAIGLIIGLYLTFWIVPGYKTMGYLIDEKPKEGPYTGHYVKILESNN